MKIIGGQNRYNLYSGTIYFPKKNGWNIKKIQNFHFRRKKKGSSCSDKQPHIRHANTTTLGGRHSCGGNNKGQSKK
jgi:hypothetical protein